RAGPPPRAAAHRTRAPHRTAGAAVAPTRRYRTAPCGSRPHRAGPLRHSILQGLGVLKVAT
ncbi:hypothetical protein ACWC5I_04945, partial [Kitasatospora sp. NPDC001574]